MPQIQTNQHCFSTQSSSWNESYDHNSSLNHNFFHETNRTIAHYDTCTCHSPNIRQDVMEMSHTPCGRDSSRTPHKTPCQPTHSFPMFDEDCPNTKIPCKIKKRCDPKCFFHWKHNKIQIEQVMLEQTLPSNGALHAVNQNPMSLEMPKSNEPAEGSESSLKIPFVGNNVIQAFVHPKIHNKPRHIPTGEACPVIVHSSSSSAVPQSQSTTSHHKSSRGNESQRNPSLPSTLFHEYTLSNKGLYELTSQNHNNTTLSSCSYPPSLHHQACLEFVPFTIDSLPKDYTLSYTKNGKKPKKRNSPTQNTGPTFLGKETDRRLASDNVSVSNEGVGMPASPPQQPHDVVNSSAGTNKMVSRTKVFSIRELLN